MNSGLHRRRLITSVLAAAAVPQFCWAQAYPTRPITIVIPYSPGGGSDALVRTAGARMAELLGQPIVIDNRPGASGLLAARQVARQQPPDGYTVFFGGPGHYAINQSLFRNMPYNPGELVPVTIAGQLPFVIVVNPQLTPVRNFQELIDLSKRSPDGLTYGTTGSGTQPHLMMLLLERQTGLRLKPIPYKGAGPILQDLIGGHVQISALDFGTVAGQLQSGGVRAIAVSSPERVSGFPDIPTLSESAVANFSVTGWYGFAVRVGTPRPIVERLATAYAEAVADPTVRRKISEQHIRPMFGTPKEFANLILSETERYAKVIRDAGIPVQE
ncbi:MAG: Bug family tripartite tricarboxylate transporter substrate binding protein [Thermomicrobiales bacterium]